MEHKITHVDFQKNIFGRGGRGQVKQRTQEAVAEFQVGVKAKAPYGHHLSDYVQAEGKIQFCIWPTLTCRIVVGRMLG